MTVLDDAARRLEENARYGHPAVNLGRQALLLNALGFRRDGFELGPGDVIDMMFAVKLARRHSAPTHRDTLVDLAGYARAAEMLLGRDAT